MLPIRQEILTLQAMLYIQRKMVSSVCLITVYFYTVYCINIPSIGLSPFETTSDDQEVALVGGLHPAVTYTFRVFAINSIDASAPTEPVVAKTQEEGMWTTTPKYRLFVK